MIVQPQKLPKVTYFETCPTRVNGQESKRALVVLNSHRPCSYALRSKPPKPCKFCAFWKGSPAVDGEPFETIISKAAQNGAKRIELLPGGSMLDQKQIRTEELRSMLDLLSKLSIESVFIPSRPEFVDDRLVEFVKILGQVKLEIGLGLETFDDSLRESLGKGFTTADYLAAVERIVNVGAIPVTFILTGLEMSRENAMTDLMETGRRLGILQKQYGIPLRIALEPYFKTKSTSVTAGAYMSPEFIAEAVISLVKDFGLEVFVATSGEGHSTHPLESVKAQIEQFNLTQKIEVLVSLLDRSMRGNG
ncbi:MAG: radical SAM protein [Candidatus Micrarchaeota archaeon]